MNDEEFVDAIRHSVLEAAVDSMEKLLDRPPGRSPSKDLVEMSAWYNSLNSADKEVMIKIITESVRGAVFGFLCVLDGVRSIESNDKGILKLYYERRGEKILLNDQDRFNLHDLL